MPPLHWLIMSVVSAAVIVFLLIRRGGPSRGGSNPYNAVAFGVTVFICLALLDILVIRRLIPGRPPQQGFDLLQEFRRVFSGNEEYGYSMLFNVLLFIPLGFSLSEYLSSRPIRPGAWQTLKSVALFAFAFSLCCECLQYVLRVGISELTDILLNTLGALAGASLSLLVRGVVMKLLSAKTLIF